MAEIFVQRSLKIISVLYTPNWMKFIVFHLLCRNFQGTWAEFAAWSTVATPGLLLLTHIHDGWRGLTKKTFDLQNSYLGKPFVLNCSAVPCLPAVFHHLSIFITLWMQLEWQGSARWVFMIIFPGPWNNTWLKNNPENSC